MSPKYPQMFRVLSAGAALSLGLSAGACETTAAGDGTDGPPEPIRGNPPAPKPPEEPKKALPSWDEVPSGHPEGATNPPRPVFQVTADGKRCFKDWEGSMLQPDRELMQFGGRVLATAADAKGTEIACDAAQVEAVLKAKREADGQD